MLEKKLESILEASGRNLVIFFSCKKINLVSQTLHFVDTEKSVH